MNIPFLLKVMRLRRRLRAQSFRTRAEIDRYQSVAVNELRRFAYEHSPFYRRYHAGLENRPLSELPTVTKAQLMDAFDDVVTDRAVRFVDLERHLREKSGADLFLHKYRVNTTSGSTGHRGLFLFNQEEWRWIIASYSRSYEWGGVVPTLTRRPKMAVVSTTVDWHQSAQVGASVRSRWVPTLRLDSTEPIGTIVARLNEWQPETLVGYASMMRLLAEEQIRGDLRIHPHAVFSASEVLTGAMRQRIRSAWGVDPFNVYGATETSTIASECGEHRMHLFEDLVVTEVVDDRNRPVPIGEIGAKILVTVLFSRTLPLIRYEMSDTIGILNEQCPCGREYHLVGMIEGRREDTLTLASAGGGTVDLHPIVLHDVLDLIPTDGWQVILNDNGLDILLVDPMEQLQLEEVIASIKNALERAGAAPVNVSARRVDAIPRGKFGKAPLVRVDRGTRLEQ